MLVKERMTSPAMTVTPDTSFQDALKLMRDHKFRRIPVVDHEGKLIGIELPGIGHAQSPVQRTATLPQLEADGKRRSGSGRLPVHRVALVEDRMERNERHLAAV